MYICIFEYYYEKALRKDESILSEEYGLTTLQQRQHTQLGCIMYRYSKNAIFFLQNLVEFEK